MALPDAGVASADLLGHPRGLLVCFFTEMWERFSFYGMKALLLLYMLKHHLFGDKYGYLVLGAYAGLVYAMPVLGGAIGDRLLGMRRAVIWGGVLLCFGHLGMAYEGDAATVDAAGVVHRDPLAMAAFYLSLSFIICGVGYLKPNIASIVGRLYPDRDARRDSGFTLYYAGINLGALFSSLICGYVGEHYGWRFGFGAAGIGMLAGLGVFIAGQAQLLGRAEAPDPARLQLQVLGPLRAQPALALATLGMIALVAFLLSLPSLVAGVQGLMLAAWGGWLAWFLVRHASKVERERMLSILFFITFVMLFFALYEQTYASWVTFTDRLLTKDLFPSLVERHGKPLPWSIWPLAASPLVVVFALRQRDNRLAALALGALGLVGAGFVLHDSILLPQTAGSLTYLGAILIVALSPIFSWLWPALERRGANPPKVIKCAIGLALAGLSFLPLSWAASAVGGGGGELGSVWWLVLAYVILEFGEVCLSPITLAAVSELSMAKVAAIMMSGWLLATSFAEQLAALLSSLASIEQVPGEGINVVEAGARYHDLFASMVWVGLLAAGVALACYPLLKRWMHGIR